MGIEESSVYDNEEAGFRGQASNYYETNGYNDDDDDNDNRGTQINTKYSRMDGSKIQEFMEDNPLDDEDGTMLRASHVKMPFNGIWSIKISEGKCPAPRTGHFTAYSPELRTCFIGYGRKRNGQLLNDVWALDVDDYKWTKLRLTGDPIVPRAGSVATVMGNYIVIFGGEAADEGRYFAELHTIDVTTGEVLIADAKGSQPAPRKEAVIAIYRKRLYIWGGFNSNRLSELNVLDFSSMKWGIVQTDVKGRLGSSWAVNSQRILIYSGEGKKNNNFTCVDMKNCSVSKVPSQGSAPKANVANAGMVKAGSYLLFFGGQSKNRFTMVYGCELSTLWWFVFFVAPDGETTSLSDGKISSDGVFELPRTTSFSSIYDSDKRQILAFLGHPHKSPAPIFVLSVGQALSFLNLREDMMGMLEMSLDASE